MTKKFIFATISYVVITFVLAAPWHFVLFPDLYENLGMYNKQEPIMALGMLAMLIQGLVLAFIYPRYYGGGKPIAEGIKFGLIMGVFLFSVSTLANAAKIQVSSVPTFISLQLAFHVIQFILVGIAIGLIYGNSSTRNG